jgi:hypothetical protein
MCYARAMAYVIGRRAWGALLLVLALSPSACGGSAASNQSGTDAAFVGRWLGPWSSSGSFGSQTGTADLTIGNNGAIAGTMHNATTGGDGTLSGFIDPDGHVTGSYAYGTVEYASSGQMLLQDNGNLGGAVHTYQGENKVATTTLDLTKQ